MELVLALAVHSKKFLPVLHRRCLSLSKMSLCIFLIYSNFSISVWVGSEVEVILISYRGSHIISSFLFLFIYHLLYKEPSVSLYKHLNAGSNKLCFMDGDFFVTIYIYPETHRELYRGLLLPAWNDHSPKTGIKHYLESLWSAQINESSSSVQMNVICTI